MINTRKIIIVEGRDQVGKSTCIQSIADTAYDNGYQVAVMFNHARPAFQENKQILYPAKHFQSLYPNNKKLSDFGGCSLESLSYSLRNMFQLASDKTCIIFDRCHLSALVYGIGLRPEQFIKIHGGLDLYIDYFQQFESYIQQIAEVHMIVITAANDTDKDDLSNPVAPIDATKMNLTNELFKTYSELSIINHLHKLEVIADDSGYYDTFKQYKQVILPKLNLS